MSAFVGLLLLNGAPCPQSLAADMLGRLRHRVDGRGWAGAQVRCEGPVGFGYAPRLTTPHAERELERPDECQTLSHNGLSLWITSDVRLDDRKQLAEKLELSPQTASDWSDGRLILEAYARWGREAPSHLRGDFAFAIWDAPRHRLFCARDRFGTKPFYYAYKSGQFFTFANEIKALWAVPDLEKDPNENQIASYLLSSFDDKTSTFYTSVRRLPPASWFEVAPRQNAAPKPNSYWKLDAQRELVLPRDEDYAPMLRETFTRSVRERMRSQDPIAVFLSGGLDSSSIAAVVEREASSRERPINTLSTIFDRFSECDEREFIEQTLARGEFAPLWMPGDDISPLGNLEKLVWHLDQPPVGANSCSAWAQYALLQQGGFNVVLDGHGGDEAVFLGYERVLELLHQGDFATAWRESRLLRSYGVLERSPASLMWQGLLRKGRGQRGLGRIIATWTRSQSHRQERRQARRQQRLRQGRADPTDRDLELFSARLLHPDLASRLSPQPRRTPFRSVRETHFKTLDGPLQPLALEILDGMASAYAVEARYPFWEQTLIETCLSFPAEQKMRNGLNRYVMRQAMEGVLAPAVLRRAGKTDFSPHISQTLLQEEKQRIEQTLQLWESALGSGVSRYVDLGEVQGHWTNLQNSPPSSAASAAAAVSLWKVLALGLWLNQQGSENSA